MAIQERLYTADDLWEMSHGENAKRLELSKGIIIEVSPTGEVHTVIAAWLLYLIMRFVELHDLGEVTGEAGGYLPATDPDIVRAPDIGFVAKERLTLSTSEKYVPLAPDLAGEIMSPGDTAAEINDKILEYLQAGTRLIWVVYPKSRTVTVYRSLTDVHILDLDGTLDGFDVLPGFSLPVRDVFKKLRA
jgi:Uma2 family endonuclease